jgi:hypothetical protein
MLLNIYIVISMINLYVLSYLIVILTFIALLLQYAEGLPNADFANDKQEFHFDDLILPPAVSLGNSRSLTFYPCMHVYTGIL